MFNKRHIVRTIAATVSILALSFTAACGSGQSTASNSTDSDDITQQTYKPGKADHRHRTAGLRAVGYERQAGKR